MFALKDVILACADPVLRSSPHQTHIETCTVMHTGLCTKCNFPRTISDVKQYGLTASIYPILLALQEKLTQMLSRPLRMYHYPRSPTFLNRTACKLNKMSDTYTPCALPNRHNVSVLACQRWYRNAFPYKSRLSLLQRDQSVSTRSLLPPFDDRLRRLRNRNHKRQFLRTGHFIQSKRALY